MNIVPNQPFAEYVSGTEASKSLLDQVARSPLHAKAYMDGAERKETDAMAEGTAFHTALLEPDRFALDYVPFDLDRRTKAGKAAYAEILAGGRVPIKPDLAQRITGMRASAMAIPELFEMLAATDILMEAGVYWTDEATGLACRCRPDILIQSLGVVIDVKKCRDASPAGFARAIANYRYHVQAAHYLKGTGAERFIFLAIEAEAPFACALYELDEASLERGLAVRDADMATLAACMSSGEWPGYPAGITSVSLPIWAMGADDGGEGYDVQVSFSEEATA